MAIRRRNTTLYLEGGSVVGENAASFIARLRDPIVIDQESEVALNSIVLDFPEDNTVQQGVNDQIGFSLQANGAKYAATVAAGVYTSTEQATELQRTLNNTGPPGESPGFGDTGSWRAAYDAAGSSPSYSFKYQIATRSAPVNGNVTATYGTYNAGSFAATTAGTVGTCLLKQPLATNIGYALAQVETAKSFTWGIVASTDAAAVPIVEAAYDQVTEEFVLTVRGVQDAPIPLPGALAKSTIIAAKHGHLLILGYRLASATAVSAFTEFRRIELRDTDGPAASGNLVTPQLYAVFTTPEVSPVFTNIKQTNDPFATTITLDVGGTSWEVDGFELAKHDATVHAQLYGGETNGLAALPPVPGSSRNVALNFNIGATIAGLTGFGPTEKVTKPASGSAPAEFDSTRVPQASIDTTGLQTALYVTSSALNVGSRYSSSAAVSTPFILGSVPAVAQYGKQSHIEFTASDPFYQHVSISGRQALTNIDLQIRDSGMVVVALPNSASDASRSRIELRVKNHPVA